MEGLLPARSGHSGLPRKCGGGFCVQDLSTAKIVTGWISSILCSSSHLRHGGFLHEQWTVQMTCPSFLLVTFLIIQKAIMLCLFERSAIKEVVSAE